jgi:hypothetical protein
VLYGTSVFRRTVGKEAALRFTEMPCRTLSTGTRIVVLIDAA